MIREFNEYPKTATMALIDELGEQIEELEHMYERSLLRNDREQARIWREQIANYHVERRNLMLPEIR